MRDYCALGGDAPAGLRVPESLLTRREKQLEVDIVRC